MRFRRNLLILVASLVVLVSAFALVASRSRALKSRVPTVGGVPAKVAFMSPGKTKVSDQHLRRARVLPQLLFALRALGDRLEQSGKERLALNGLVQFSGEAQPAPFDLLTELPGNRRLSLQQGVTQRSLLFNDEAAATDKQLDAQDSVLLDTFAYDTADRFFMGQMDETSPRFLGSHYRDDDGTQSPYTGPYYDIYQVTDRVNTGEGVKRQSKLFFFNSATHLLEKVTYTVSRSGLPVEVEVQISDWRAEQGQQIPRHIVRLENQKPVLTISIASAAVGPQVKDGLFAAP